MIWSFLLALIAPLLSAVPATTAVAAYPAVVDSTSVSAFGEQRAPFAVRFGETTTDYRVMAMFALPGQHVAIEARDTTARVPEAPAQFELSAASGAAAPQGDGHWTWVAPARAGLYPVVVRNDRGDAVTLNVFVMVPYSAMRHGRVNGYRVGAYPAPRRGHESEYQRPPGFIEVTDALLDTHVSPHFTLGQFVCKQAGGWPRYMVLRQPLLEKLEQLLAAVNERGIDAPTFSIMSAYRTPSYNAAIGNVTTYSRHEYGDAADIFVDADGDGVMDDLNHDGRHTEADSRVLAGIVTRLEGEASHLVGGHGTYGPTSEHGPFTHVDVRGFAVEWSA